MTKTEYIKIVSKDYDSNILNENYLSKHWISIMQLAVYYNNIDTIKWILTKTDDINYKILHQSFVEAIQFGYFELTRFLYQHLQITYNYDVLYNGFRYACSSGFIEIAKWLYDLHPTTFEIYNDITWAFRLSCANGFLEISQWLYSLGADYRVNNDFAFRWSCQNGHLDVAKWLYSLGVNIHSDRDYAFKWSCRLGHFEMAKWLYSIGCSEIDIDNDWIFTNCCKFKRVEIVKWLANMEPRYRLTIKDNEIIEWSIVAKIHWSNLDIDQKLKLLNISTNVSNEQLECVLCQSNNQIIEFNCKHKMCLDCLCQYLLEYKYTFCPYCRQEIINKTLLVSI